MAKVLYGTESNNCAAFCEKHFVKLTPKQIKKKECLCKQCNYLKKYMEHPIWAEREAIKQKRRERKAALMGKEIQWS